jgi:Family of unknown function (DUF6188)
MRIASRVILRGWSLQITRVSRGRHRSLPQVGHRVTVTGRGTLTLDLDDGAQLIVSPDPQYESWELQGDGISGILVGPGGETSWETNRTPAGDQRWTGSGARRAGYFAASPPPNSHGVVRQLMRNGSGAT